MATAWPSGPVQGTARRCRADGSRAVGYRREGIWLQDGHLTLRRQRGFHLHEICVLCPAPALTALRSPWAAAVGRTDLTLTFPGGVKCKVRSVKCSELPFLLF